jgi:hypothetical protein
MRLHGRAGSFSAQPLALFVVELDASAGKGGRKKIMLHESLSPIA